MTACTGNVNLRCTRLGNGTVEALVDYNHDLSQVDHSNAPGRSIAQRFVSTRLNLSEAALVRKLSSAPEPVRLQHERILRLLREANNNPAFLHNDEVESTRRRLAQLGLRHRVLDSGIIFSTGLLDKPTIRATQEIFMDSTSNRRLMSIELTSSL